MDEYNYNILLGNVTTAIFMIIACYVGTIKFHQTQNGLSQPISIDDFIPLGYVEEDPQPINKPIKAIKSRGIERPKKQPIKPVKRNANGFTELQQDCYDALKGLKISNKESKYLVHSIFNKHNPKTIQDFLQLAFMRAS